MIEVDFLKSLGGFRLSANIRSTGQTLVLFGPSGSGKSTLLKCVAGLTRPDAGSITIRGDTVFDSSRGFNVPAQERHIGYVPQNYALFPHLTVEQNVGYGLAGLEGSVMSARVKEMLDLMRLSQLEKRKPAELSGGQQQRVAIARALAVRPRLLLLDEPFSVLDSAIRAKLCEDILEAQHRLGVGIVLVTHDIPEAYTFGECISVLDNGQVLQTGPREEVFNHPATRTVARFTGARNILSGRVLETGNGEVVIQAGKFTIKTREFPCRPGEEVECCIRPENVMFLRKDRPEGAPVRENQIDGWVVHEVNHGAFHTVYFAAGPAADGDYRDYDLEIALPAHAYENLGLEREKHWTVSLKKNSIHVIGRMGGLGEEAAGTRFDSRGAQPVIMPAE
ncbi:MAG: ABC transporter ATP-binding protein [Chloroflexi bacterium]|nr:ABC transporter ATP-binding protein [Chloroflexota bacterium]